MDRPIVYPGAIPLDTDLLNTNRNVMKALGMLMQAVMGSSTVVSGLAVSPSAPAAMSVVVGPGSIFQLSTVDATAYGSLGADTADALMKQGINISSTTLAIAAPTTSGYAQNYLIEAALLEQDTGPVVLPYYNAGNPSSPYLGPGNSGTAQNTLRAETVQLQAKAGVPATAGTQATPGVDAGWVPLAVVTAAYGASSIVSGNISIPPGAPLLPALGFLSGLHGTATMTASGTWTCPAFVTTVYVSGCGAGGAGGAGGGNGVTGGSGGGGAQAVLKQPVTVVPGTTYTLTIGGAGTGTAGAGGAGGATSFDVLLSLAGGSGGVKGSGTGSVAGGAAGGAGGQAGGAGYLNGQDVSVGGAGGGCLFGATQSQTCGGTLTLPAAAGYGAGGSGNGAGGNGANGAPGVLILEW